MAKNVHPDKPNKIWTCIHTTVADPLTLVTPQTWLFHKHSWTLNT